MDEPERPILLVVGDEPERLARVRLILREAGALTAPARSLDSAYRLLTQIVMDGCVLCSESSPEEAQSLAHAIQETRPGTSRVWLRDDPSSGDGAWPVCREAELTAWVRSHFPSLDL